MKIEKKKRISNEIEQQTLTLTLEIKGRGTYLVRAPLSPPVRGTPGSPLRDAGVARAGLESMAPTTAGSTAARSPSGERACRRASRGGAAPPAPPGHHGQWPSPPSSGERNGRGESPRVWGDTASSGFDPAKRAPGRPILIGGDGRLGTVGGERAKSGPRGSRVGAKIPAQAHAAAWAQGRRAPSGPRAGFRFWAASTMMIFNVFSIFQNHFL